VVDRGYQPPSNTLAMPYSNNSEHPSNAVVTTTQNTHINHQVTIWKIIATTCLLPDIAMP